MRLAQWKDLGVQLGQSVRVSMMNRSRPQPDRHGDKTASPASGDALPHCPSDASVSPRELIQSLGVLVVVQMEKINPAVFPGNLVGNVA